MNLSDRFAIHPDVRAVAFLVALWLLFFWRLFTPVQADQASLEKGDFSGQFVAFGGYQYARLTVGEIPLWNPYNNGGFPFIGDTQTAVFYPPRLATIGVSYQSGGWSYHALELEMTAHVLACSLFMYAFVRRLTTGQHGSASGALIAAIVFSYGGFLGSYPPLQLAILEAAVWLPVGLLGIVEATRSDQLRRGWLLLTGFAYGMTWMAGHPQTAWFTTFVLVGWAGYRCVHRPTSKWRTFLVMVSVFGIVGVALAAVQLIPGLEYLSHSTRAGLGFDAKGNGFPFQDIIQFVVPGLTSLWSPLYVGLVGLTLAFIAIWRRVQGAPFWAAVSLVALGLSFGANSPIYALFYNTVPALRFFRGQERAAFPIAFSLAVLAGLGAIHLRSWDKLIDFKATRFIQQCLLILFVICAGLYCMLLLAGLGTQEVLGQAANRAAFSAMTAGLTLLSLRWLMANPSDMWRIAMIIGLLVFDLFTLSMDRASNYDPIPPGNQISRATPPLVAQVVADTNIPFRVDGYRGLLDNYGSLYGVADMRGISPLFLDGPFSIQQNELINPLAWELFAVRYVYSDWNELPVDSRIIGEGTDRYGPVKIHRLGHPRPFALLMGEYRIIEDSSVMRATMQDRSFDPRTTVLLDRDPGINSQASSAESGFASIQEYLPESIEIAVEAPSKTILSISLPYYPGWKATVNGAETTILKAYDAFSAIVVPSGTSTVRITYDPLSFKVGAIISLIAWIGLGSWGLLLLVRRTRDHE